MERGGSCNTTRRQLFMAVATPALSRSAQAVTHEVLPAEPAVSPKAKSRLILIALAVLLAVILLAVPIAIGFRSVALLRQAAYHRSLVKDVRDGDGQSSHPKGSLGRYHVDSAEAYEDAAWRPWTRLSLPPPLPPGFEEQEIEHRKKRHEEWLSQTRERDRQRLLDSQAPAPNPPKP